MLNKVRSVGEKMARKIEIATSSPEGWMDKFHDQEATPTKHFHVAEPLIVYISAIVDWENPEDLPPNKYAFVARRQVKIDRNRVLYADLGVPPIAFPTQWIKKNELHHSNLATFEVSGNAMEPRIYSGDTVLINRGKTEVEDGKIYALRYGHELRVNRLYRRYDGILILRSYNRDSYPDENIPTEALKEQLEIIGRVVWAAGEVNS